MTGLWQDLAVASSTHDGDEAASRDGVRRPSRARLVGLDVARAAAILGMLAVNVGPGDGSGPAAWVTRAAHGRASILFVLLAGVGLTLLTRRALEGGPSRRATLFWRAGVLLAIGLVLQVLDHDVSVILPTYAALFVLAAALVRAPDRLLLGGAAGVTVAGPVLWILLQRGGEFDRAPASLADSPFEILASVVATGPYPLVTWSAPFLFGMWLGRRDLRDRRLVSRLLVLGAVGAVGGMVTSRVLVRFTGQPGEVVGLDRLVSAVAHSQMPLWLISGTGSALAVLAALVLLTPHLKRFSRPLVALGQLSLTVYVAHLVVLSTVVRPGPWTPEDGLLITAVIGVAATIGATMWRSAFNRGPLEATLRLPRSAG
ncbi:DUF418 domain-containing protein [Georgenia deserti]|uniref:DUF418 domain-containing protein n=1 Tax=Georgenia deserti TaxID=2093781 RepID=A0ABW4L2P9_9MICO